jgi:hypothetical protein
MSRGQQRQQSTSNSGIIGGHRYHIGGNVATRPVAPGARVGREVHVTTPHPDPQLRARGWRMAWIFLGTIAALACGAMYCLGLVQMAP